LSAQRADAPTLGVLATGGVGVLVVLAFVAAIVFGRGSVAPGDRIAVVRSDGPVGFTVLAGRCTDERVKAVEVHVPDGPPLWRIESAKGVINRSFAVGAEPPPFGATTVTPLQPLPPGTLEVLLTVDGETDHEQFDPAHLESADAPEAPCSTDLGLVPVLFVIGAAGVVIAYSALVRRYLQAR
jgi:hypothetical protein